MPTQDIDIIVDGKALVFSATTRVGRLTAASNPSRTYAVFSIKDHSTLFNNGVIVSYAANGFAGVRFMGDYGQIYNFGQVGTPPASTPMARTP